MSTVELPDGQHAELRDKLTIGGRETLAEVSADLYSLIAARCPTLDELKQFSDLPPSALDGQMMRAFHRLNRAAVLVYLKSWTLPEPVPRAEVSLNEMDPDVYDALAAAVAPLAMAQIRGANFEPDPSNIADPDSPTGPSSVSGGGGQAPTTPTMNPQNGSSENAESSTTAGSFL